MQTILSEQECQLYCPKAALIVFENHNNKSQSFIEFRPIRPDGTMGAAKPISHKFMQGLAENFSYNYQETPHGEIPENLIYADSRKGKQVYIWYNPPMKRNRFFDDKLGLTNGLYYVPGTLYVVEDSNLSVFCFPGEKPLRSQPLLGVPYFNVYSNGKVCMGSAKPQFNHQMSYESFMKAWEDAFWNSIDVHTNGSPSTKHNLIDTIKKYKNKPFDYKELEVRKDNLSIDGIIKQIK